MKFRLLASLRKSIKKSEDAVDPEAKGETERIGIRSARRSRYRRKTRRSSVDKDGVKGAEAQGAKDGEGNFPCCCYIPLDIAMEGFALIDIIYYTCFALAWAIFVALEPFAGKDEGILLARFTNSSDPNHPSHSGRSKILGLGEAALNELLARSRTGARSYSLDDEPLNFDDFKETTTTFAPFHDQGLDKMNEARVYSRIARQFKEFGQEIDDGCGRDYFVEFLYSNQLQITRTLFEDVARKAIYSSLLYALFGCILLSTICCFRGYIASKMLVILLWYLQLVPSYLILRAAVMSQSHRLCILQYGVGKTTRGQSLMFWSLLWPLLSYKPYEAFIWANYIRRYFNNKEGKLLDESYFSAGKLEERQHREFEMNPYTLKDEFQHHHRAVGTSRLFRHALKRDYEFEKTFRLLEAAKEEGPTKPHDSSTSM